MKWTWYTHRFEYVRGLPDNLQAAFVFPLIRQAPLLSLTVAKRMPMFRASLVLLLATFATATPIPNKRIVPNFRDLTVKTRITDGVALRITLLGCLGNDQQAHCSVRRERPPGSRSITSCWRPIRPAA